MHTQIDQFTESLRARQLSANTIRPYRSELLRLAGFLTEEGVPLDDVTQHQLTSYIACNGFANASTARQLVILRQFFTWMKHPVAESLKEMKGPKVTRPVPDFLSADEEKQLRRTLKERTDQRHQARDQAIICLILDTGIRVGEVAGLNVSDVDLGAKRVRIMAKGGKLRSKFLSTALRSVLSMHLTQELQRNSQDPLFLSSRSLRLCDRQIRRIVTRWAGLAGIAKSVHPHTLRHTFATSLLAQNGNLRLVQKALDHASPQTTAIYTHVVDSELQEALEGRSAI